MDNERNDIVVSSGASTTPAKHESGHSHGYGYGYGYGYGSGSGGQGALGGFRFDPIEAFKRLWFVVVLFALLGGAASMLVLPHFIEPEYEATTLLRVRAEVPRVVGEALSTGDYEKQMGTHVARIRDSRNLLNTLSDDKVRELSWVRNTTEMRAIERARKRLDVRRVNNTELIEIGFIDYQSSEAKVFVESLVRSYLGIVQDEETQEQVRLLHQLEERREHLRTLIDGAREGIRGYNAEIPSTDLETYQEKLLETITDAENAVITERIRSKAASLRLEKLDAEEQGESSEGMARNEAREVQAIVSSALQDDPTLLRLRDHLSMKEEEYGIRSVGLTDQERQRGHAALQKLQREIDLLEQQIQEREDRLRRELTAEYTEMLANNERGELVDIVDQAEIIVAAQLQLLEEKRKELQEVSEKQHSVVQLEEELARYQEQSDEVVARINELSLNQGGRFLERYKWDGIVTQPNTPVPDKLNKLRLLTVGGSIFVGSLLVVLVAGFDTRLKRVADLQALGPIDVIGVLPRLQDLAKRTGIDNVGEQLSEEFRMIRTRLLHMPGFQEKQALMIASPTPSSGKTTVSVNLAALIAQSGRRVLLVDGDLRKPDIHRVLDIPLNLGVSDVLQGKAKLEDVVVPVSPGLDVLTAGSAVSKPSELLSRRSVKKAVESWGQKYDLVVFDTSPLLPVSDGRVLAGVCDSSLLIVRADHADRRDLAETMSILEATPVQTLGVVLNGVKIRHGGGKKSRGYYSYRDAYRGRGQTPPPAQIAEDTDSATAGFAVEGDVVEQATPKSSPDHEV